MKMQMNTMQEKLEREMIHRYLAGFLGIGIFGLALYSLRSCNGFRSLEVALVPLVVFQSILGMFTVTLLLKPLVVSLHLMGGLTILCVLWWSLLRDLDLKGSVIKKSGLLKRVGWLAFSALVVQIFLGGWTSTNYAGRWRVLISLLVTDRLCPQSISVRRLPSGEVWE